MFRGFRRNSAGAGQAPTPAVDVNDAYEQALQLERRDDLAGAEKGYAAADRLGHATAAVRLGVLLEERDDLSGAESAFRRADARGDATGAFHLAWLLQERGDLTGAEQAYRRAEMRGHAAAEANLRVLQGRRSEGRGAPAAPTTSRAPAEADTAVHSLPGTAAAPGELGARAPGRLGAGARGSSTPGARRGSRAREAGAAGAGQSGTAARDAGAPAPTVTGPRRRDTAGEPSASDPADATRRGSVGRWTVSVLLPVAAFAAAFLVGELTKPTSPRQAQLAPAVTVSDSSVTVKSVSPVPGPPRLSFKAPRKSAKPAAAAPAAGGAVYRPVEPAAPLYRPVVQSPAAPLTAAASEPRTSSHGQTTTATAPDRTTTSGKSPGSTTTSATNSSSATSSGTSTSATTSNGAHAGTATGSTAPTSAGTGGGTSAATSTTPSGG